MISATGKGGGWGQLNIRYQFETHTTVNEKAERLLVKPFSSFITLWNEVFL